MQRTKKRSNKTRSRLPPHNAETGALCRRHCPGIRWHHHEGRAGGWKCVFSSVTNPSNPPGTFTEKCSHTVTLCVPWPGGCYSSLNDRGHGQSRVKKCRAGSPQGGMCPLRQGNLVLCPTDFLIPPKRGAVSPMASLPSLRKAIRPCLVTVLTVWSSDWKLSFAWEVAEKRQFQIL